MKSLLVTIFVFFSTLSYSQNDTVIYFDKLNRVCPVSIADFSIAIKKKDDKKFSQITKKVNKNFERVLDEKLEIEILNDTSCRIVGNYIDKIRIFHTCDSGYLITDTDRGTISKGFSKSVFPLIKSGKWIVVNSSNNIKLSEEIYEGNEMVANYNWNEDGSTYFDDVFIVTETPPLYKNKDLVFVNSIVVQSVRYPKMAVENGIMGKVYLQFLILEDGSMDGIRVLRGVDPSLDKEAIRALKEVKGKWTPATIRGKPVNTSLILPIVFRLQQ